MNNDYLGWKPFIVISLMKYKIVPSSTESKERFFYLMEKLLQILKDQNLNQILLSQGTIKDASWNFLQHFHIFESLTKVFFFVYFVNNSFKKPRRKEKYSLWIFFSRINKCNAFSLTRRQVFAFQFLLSPTGA